jgi:hypothetical protein
MTISLSRGERGGRASAPWRPGTYALAKALDAPLLFIGDDLKATDIIAAI